MTSKELTALEALMLLKNLRQNNINDQEVEDMLLDIIEKELKEHRLLKKLEEELGIDLITLFKALKKGVYVKYDSDFGMTGKPNIKIVKDNATGVCYRDKKWYIQEADTLIKDYGKDWALTREELEDE